MKLVETVLTPTKCIGALLMLRESVLTAAKPAEVYRIRFN